MSMKIEAGSRHTDALNRDCHCISVNKEILRASLEANLKDAGLPGELLDVHRHLFADTPVFLWQGHIDRMARLIRAVQTVASNVAYREAVLAAAPASAREDHGSHGVFFGFDFHLGEDGPQLIEINTNAGGVLLNLYLAAAQQACCTEVVRLFGGNVNVTDAENELIDMFKEEWRLQRGDLPLGTIAIVDTEPRSQFLYPEFLLFQSLFERHGIAVVIADPKELSVRERALWAGNQRIDLVYNRLTDFYFQMPESASLLAAYKEGIAVFTPSPYAYALFADKRNLPILSDRDRLKAFGVDDETIETLGQQMPATVMVTQENAGQLWEDRKELFFKPVTGYGSRGAYRGAKLTRKVWERIVHSDYVAQAVVPPSERHLIINGQKQSLKLDIRCVSYNGDIQQLSARLYQGQTTNLRTEGGGLATVFATPDGVCC
ncbi:MAG TPA: hypothetical protein PKK10_00590 [Woeseiaceae bacterium]|nr:hypothetical protein [Woeseiaceae bacterium]